LVALLVARQELALDTDGRRRGKDNQHLTQSTL